MKNLICLIIFFLAFNQPLFPQSLKCRISSDLNLHLKQKESSGLYSPYSYEIEQPSIAAFYDDNIGVGLDVSYRFPNDITQKGQVFIGFKYERASISSNNLDVKYILGESILKNKFIPYLGYGKYLDMNEYYTFLYGFGGFVIKNYSGQGNIPGELNGTPVTLEAKYQYSSSLSVRMGAGIDFENINDSPLTICLQASVEIGKIDRENIDFFYQGHKIGEGTPTGHKSLYDNTIYISALLAYQINWGNTKE